MNITGWIYGGAVSVLAVWAVQHDVPIIPVLAAIGVSGTIMMRLGMILKK